MPPSHQQTINTLIFRKMILNSRHFIILRLDMREAERARISTLDLDLNDPNCEIIDLDKGDKDFKLLV